MQGWKKAGPLGKLHNLCVKIHASPQLLAKFKAISKGLTLPQDNATRWGSWFKMIERGLHLQKAITQFHDLWLEGDDEGKLLQEDWDTLKKVRGSPGHLLSPGTHITANIDLRLPS